MTKKSKAPAASGRARNRSIPRGQRVIHPGSARKKAASRSRGGSAAGTSVEDLRGGSEHSARSADDGDDPMTGVERSHHPRPSGIARASSPEVDELGAHFLERAVQSFDQSFSTPTAAASESPAASPGEQRMWDAQPGLVEDEDGLVTQAPHRSDVERKLSEASRRAGREVRNPRRGERIRKQSERVAELLADEQGEYLGEGH